MENELLPCPFCGREAKRHDIEAREDVDNAGASYIECSRCGACTQLHFDRKENLISSWNNRARSLPKWRCYHCDNGIEFEWEYCAWCGASEGWKTAEHKAEFNKVSDAVLNDILKATGEWCEPYEAPRESGVPIDGDMSQQDADSINADGREKYRGILAIAWSVIAEPPEKDIVALAEAHQMEIHVLYEALERALSHFVVIGGDHAKRAAQEIEELMAGVAEQSGAGAPETSVRCGAPAATPPRI